MSPNLFAAAEKKAKPCLHYFTETLPVSTEGNHTGSQPSTSLIEDCLILSSKGLYCFDVDTRETYGDFYRKVSYPSKELLISDLPGYIKDILSDHIVSVDVSTVDKLTVPHAY